MVVILKYEADYCASNRWYICHMPFGLAMLRENGKTDIRSKFFGAIITAYYSIVQHSYAL